jgi:hypothetical protein
MYENSHQTGTLYLNLGQVVARAETIVKLPGNRKRPKISQQLHNEVQ